jgi:hypothetical protein
MIKLVRESLNEMNFERGKSPLDALGIGRKKLIEDWFDKILHTKNNYEINKDLTVVLDSFVDTQTFITLSHEEIDRLLKINVDNVDYNDFVNKLNIGYELSLSVDEYRILFIIFNAGREIKMIDEYEKLGTFIQKGWKAWMYNGVADGKYILVK